MDKPTVLPNHKSKPYGGGTNIDDAGLIEFVKTTSNPFNIPNTFEFLDDYKAWSIQNHSILGEKRYKYLSFSNGTTETFDKFYQTVVGRRLRLWRGEYFYHQIQAREIFKKEFAWIEDGPIKLMDAVAVSVPFSDTGTVPNGFDDVMKECETLGVPVLVDMAFLNVANNLTINLDYDCIKMVTTSLSKVFPVSHLRIGIRWMQEDIDDTLTAYTHQTNPYVNTHSIHIGHELIKNYSSEYIYNKYRPQQIDLCEKLGVTPSDCVIFGIDHKGSYSEYNRGGPSNRLCLSKEYETANIKQSQ